MNRINQLFNDKEHNIVSIYFTAGFPALEDTLKIAKALEKSGADLIEIGIPFSDPVADGPTIQRSNKIALDNGMSLAKLFNQLKNLRNEVAIPVILMGYINPILQYGIERFCEKCAEVGVDGLIVPDLPLDNYKAEYADVFEKYNVKNVCLITPQTSVDRVKEIDAASNSFIYMVSSASTTGSRASISIHQEAYFQRISKMNLNNPRLIGFGISDARSFRKACNHAQGAIIGSAFISAIENSNDLINDINVFVKEIRS